MWPPSQTGDDTRDTQCPAEVVDEFEYLAESVLRTDPATGTDDGPGLCQARGVIAIGGLNLGANDPSSQIIGRRCRVRS